MNGDNVVLEPSCWCVNSFFRNVIDSSIFGLTVYSPPWTPGSSIGTGTGRDLPLSTALNRFGSDFGLGNVETRFFLSGDDKRYL